MPFDAPFRLGPFMVDELGRLQPNVPEATPSVHVRWRGLTVEVTLQATPGHEPNGTLALSALIGRVRSTAGVRPGERVRALATLRDLPGEIQPGWTMRLLPDHSARIDADCPVALPVTATVLVTVVTCFLLDLAPYLDLLEEPEAGFESVGTFGNTAGMANTCPG